MAFVPMVSASPPPLSPDVTADDLSGPDDDSLGPGDLSGDEDLTGLSDKLHSIPIEAIRAAPPPTPSKKANHNIDKEVPEEVPEVPEPVKVNGVVDEGLEEQQPPADPDLNQSESPEAQDTFCDFDSAFPTNKTEELQQQQPWDASGNVPLPNSDLDFDDDDDDFGDFDEAVVVQTPETSLISQTSELLSTLESDLKTVIGHTFNHERDQNCDTMTNYEGLDCLIKTGQIWNQIGDVGSTPALNFNWKSASSGGHLYKLLNVDPTLVHNDGISMKPLMPTVAPSTILEPTVVKTSNNRMTNMDFDSPVGSITSEAKDNVKVAERDNNNTTTTPKEEAKQIADAFPLLDFMRSPVLMFPVKHDS